jgi:hypothetical protein
MSKRDEQRVALMAGQRRDASLNNATRMADVARIVRPTIDFRSYFLRHYSRFREHVRQFEQPGLAVVAIDRARDRIAGVACVAARIGEPNALIVGRHSGAQLLLRGDEEISLRHLAVVTEPVTDFRPGRGVTYRVMDLRSTSGLRGENGKRVSAIRSDGPAFLSSANHVFFVFITGDPTDWPDSAADAWSFIPERIFLEERVRAGGSGTHRPAPPASGPAPRSITLIERVAGPTRAEVAGQLVEGEPPVAEIAVRNRTGVHRFPVGARAIEDGIIFGRADRCDSARVFQNQALSRVHLLLISINGEIVAIDTASTNGCYRGIDYAGELRVARLDPGVPVFLGSTASVSWRRAG